MEGRNKLYQLDQLSCFLESHFHINRSFWSMNDMTTLLTKRQIKNKQVLRSEEGKNLFSFRYSRSAGFRPRRLLEDPAPPPPLLVLCWISAATVAAPELLGPDSTSGTVNKSSSLSSTRDEEETMKSRAQEHRKT